ncbi:hypothetical protein STEG23_008219 [Scotinomys teguina]
MKDVEMEKEGEAFLCTSSTFDTLKSYQSVPPEDQSVPPEDQSAPPEDQSVPPEDQSVPPEDQSVTPEDQSVTPEDQSACKQILRIIRILPSIRFPFFPLGTFSPFFAGTFLGLDSGLGGAGLADNLADLLCGSSFPLALSPLVSPPTFLLGMGAAVGDVGAEGGDAVVCAFGPSGGHSHCFFRVLLTRHRFVNRKRKSYKNETQSETRKVGKTLSG